MRPADVPLIATAADPVDTDSGPLFVLRRPDLETDSYPSQVFRAAPETVRVSHGWADFGLQRAADAPVWGLLRAEAPGQAPQLHVGEHPGAVRRVSDFHLGVSAFALSADGRTALAVARIPEAGRYGTDPDVGPAAEAPRRIVHSDYLANGLGYLRDRPAQAFRIDLSEPGEELTGLLGGTATAPALALAWPGADVADPQLRPDGTASAIAAVAHGAQTPDLRSTVWLLDEQTARPLDLGDLAVSAHRWIDDTRLAFLASDRSARPTDFVAQLGGLFLHDTATGATVRLTDPDDIDLGGPLRIHDGRAWALLTEDGGVRAVALDLPAGLDGAPCLGRGDLEPLTPADHVVTGFDPTGGRLVWTAETPERTAAVFAAAAAGSADTKPAARQHWAATAPTDIAMPRRLVAQGAGGEVHGWLAVPPGEGPFPVILNIHGGPFAQYTHALFDETQVLTGAGYAVVYANPRGSAGRGRAWGKAVQGDFAEPAAADVLAVLDAALDADERLDRARLGVQGGSYGGYLTAMVIGSDHRFRAAIIERGYLVPHSFTGTSDIGTYFSEEYTGADPARIRAQSPLRAIKGTRTPALVMHSEQDLRCPLEQGQQMYLALQRAGVETEMLVFPGENHELSRSGRPRHRVQRFEAILQWWRRFLPADRG